jgi:hypothetical protein
LVLAGAETMTATHMANAIFQFRKAFANRIVLLPGSVALAILVATSITAAIVFFMAIQVRWGKIVGRR